MGATDIIEQLTQLGQRFLNTFDILVSFLDFTIRSS